MTMSTSRDIQMIEQGAAASVASPMAALIEQLERAFPVPTIRPDSTMNELQYAAGCRAVVEWVKTRQKRGKVS